MGMNIKKPGPKERRRVLQALWNFVSIAIISIMCFRWPASPVPRPFAEDWPTIVEMMDWAGTNDGTGKFRKLTQDAYEEKWEIFYGIGTKFMLEYMDESYKTDK